MQILMCIMLGVLLLMFWVNVSITIPMVNASGSPKVQIDSIRFDIYLQSVVSQIIGVCIGIGVLRSRWGKDYPERTFIGFNALVLLPAQLVAALHGEINFDGETWFIYYAIQAIIVPVHWRLHLLSQVGVLGLFTLGFLFGRRDPLVLVPSVYVMGLIYTLFICIVADVGVRWYERSRQRELELRQQLKVFLHAVSHDLRNPVLGLGMTLREFWQPDEPDAIIPQALLKQMIDSSDRQLALINSLLEAHATEARGIQLHCQSLNLETLIRSILMDLQPFLEQAQTQVIVDLDPDLPTIQGDALQLRRVYENLILNAIKYNRSGLRVTIAATITYPIQSIRCTVRDNGVGMEMKQCERLFELYRRGPNTRQTLGVGLGLYICQQIILAHGGTIGVESQPGAGTLFWFTLPIA